MKMFLIVSALFLATEAAEARSFWKQAGRDLGNGVKSVTNALKGKGSPEPGKNPMSPCNVNPRSCNNSG